MLLSVGIRSPQSVSDEWWWNCISIINETNAKGQARSKPPAWRAIDLPSALLQRCSQQHQLLAAVREFKSSLALKSPYVRMALILQCWFKVMVFVFSLVLYQHCGQRREKAKRGWLRGSGWMETRWDTGTADGQISSAQSLHHVAGGSLGDEHLLFNLTWPTVVPYIFCFIERL